MRIGIAADRGAFSLKEQLEKRWKHQDRNQAITQALTMGEEL